MTDDTMADRAKSAIASERFDPWYRALKAVEPDAYFKAIQYAEGVTLNHNLNEKAAVACEISHVILACQLLGVKP